MCILGNYWGITGELLGITESFCIIMDMYGNMLENDLRAELKRLDREIKGISPDKPSFWDKLLHPARVVHEKQLARLKNQKKHYYNKIYYWSHRDDELARSKTRYQNEHAYVPPEGQ